MNGRQAWIALLSIVGVYELFARDGQLLSEICDEWMETHPWTTRLVIYAFAAHLSNTIPDQRLDPLHWVFKVVRAPVKAMISRGKIGDMNALATK